MPVMRHDAKKEQRERDRRRRQAAERRSKIAKESADRRRTEGGPWYKERAEEERKDGEKQGKEKKVEKEAKHREKESEKRGKSTIEVSVRVLVPYDVTKSDETAVETTTSDCFRRDYKILQLPKIRPPEAKNGLARNEVKRKSTESEEPVKFKMSITGVKILGKPDRRTISVEKDVATSQPGRGTMEEDISKKSIRRVTLRLTDESIKEEVPKDNCCWRMCFGICQGSADLLKRACACPKGKCTLCHKLGEIFKRSSCSHGRCSLCLRFARLLERRCSRQEGRCRFCHRFPKRLKGGWTGLKRGCPYVYRCMAKVLNCIWTCLKLGCPYLFRCMATLLNCIWVGLKKGCPYVCRCVANFVNCIWTCLKLGCPYLFRCMATLLNCTWVGLKRGCPYLCRCMAQLLSCICGALKDVLGSAFTEAITS